MPDDTSYPPPGPERERREWHINHILLAIVAVLLLVGALRLTAPVMVPLVFSVFLIAVFWPLQRRLERVMPRGLAALASLAAFLVVVGLFAWALLLSADMASQKAPQYASQLQQMYEGVRSWAEGQGLPFPEPGGGGGRLQSAVVNVSNRIATFVGSFVLVIAFLVLGLLEVRQFRTKLHRSLGGGRSEAWMDSLREITTDFVRYIVVRTGVGLITGTLITLFCWIVGLDFAFIWGLTNFLLNYIPTLGSILGVLPPTLFALVQYDGLGMVGIVFAGVVAIQLVMGNYIDPLLQGKYLHLSPLVVLVSVTFWGWLWGIAGAFISIPITVAIVIACRHFDRTRWIATLLADVEDAPEDDPPENDPAEDHYTGGQTGAPARR